ncbi:hypothetical protein SARC_07904 [Sphaeroforma arctica JP610]|uniref:Uncharacterized protein n=1 Tax=Sphaeroforma arctica JP610 TaxID=667725 RepID=A0A0L0FSI1_9EUKA|nr:hypothetical protein SARC_07904 [Sphaeroforma arctica JP610]KNC79710.1 hypothetical protein SARC_07904 [Sphaeroforma arctica JP610]|eukprot:XP_014153612.1 hypothetical protein SARC_07904 [Sphaeroforma arctica JP610]
MIASLEHEALSRMAYLKMITPRKASSTRQSASPLQSDQANQKRDRNLSGRVTYVVRKGLVVEGQGEGEDKAKYTTWGAGNPDPTAVKKHWDLFERQKKIGL